MKSIVKAALTLSMLLPLAGCDFGFGWGKKHAEHEKAEAAHHGNAGEHDSKTCTHKNCGHDHHKDNVKTQGVDADGNYVADEDDANANVDENAEDQTVVEQSLEDGNMDDDNSNDTSSEDYSA